VPAVCGLDDGALPADLRGCTTTPNDWVGNSIAGCRHAQRQENIGALADDYDRNHYRFGFRGVLAGARPLPGPRQSLLDTVGATHHSASLDDREDLMTARRMGADPGAGSPGESERHSPRAGRAGSW
jgi:hypothetical protein